MNDYQLRIALKEIAPDVWRCVVVPGDVTLAKLSQNHSDRHGVGELPPVSLKFGREQYGEGVGEWADYDQRVGNAKRVTLEDVASRKGARFLYEYDMGDGWEHEIRVEAIAESAAGEVR